MAQPGGPRGGNRQSQTRKIFIGGLNYNSTEESLKKHFSSFGELIDVVVMKFPDTKRSRGFGFVTFSTDEEVDACQEARPHTIDGKTVETKRATPREEFGKPEAGQTVKKVFVGGLKEDMTEDDIRQYFEEFGKIVAITRLTEKDTGKPRGFGFVEFDDYDPVDKAILKGSHQINGKRVDVKKAVSKQEMNSMGMGGGGGPRGGMRGGRGGGGRGGRSFGGGNQGGWGGNQWGGGDSGWGADSYGEDGGWSESGWSQGQSGWDGSSDGTAGGFGQGGWSSSSYGGGYGSQGGYGSNGGGPPSSMGYDQQSFGGGPMMRPRGGMARQGPYGAGGGAGGFRGGRGGGGRGGFNRT